MARAILSPTIDVPSRIGNRTAQMPNDVKDHFGEGIMSECRDRFGESIISLEMEHECVRDGETHIYFLDVGLSPSWVYVTAPDGSWWELTEISTIWAYARLDLYDENDECEEFTIPVDPKDFDCFL